MGKLILIEGTDCSGKETQSKLLKEKVEKDNKTCVYFSFPNYILVKKKYVNHILQKGLLMLILKFLVYISQQIDYII